MGAAENKVSNEVFRTFGTRSDMRIFRQNCGAAIFGQQRVKFGVKGMADISGILPGGIRLEIETKSPDGRQTKEQKAWQAMIERFGGCYVLARSVDDVWARIGGYLTPASAAQEVQP